MVGVLTWPTHGSRFARPGRGRIDRESTGTLPEPVGRADARGMKWPPVRLNARQRALVIEDLERIALLRRFELLEVVAAQDHVHVVISCDEDREIPRLVQLIKGALARRLSVAAGDEPAVSVRGEGLPHHKWWARQYSFLAIRDAEGLERVRAELSAHPARETIRYTPRKGWGSIPLD